MHELFVKYLENLASPEEVREWLTFFRHPENEPRLKKLIQSFLESPDADEDAKQNNPLIHHPSNSIPPKPGGNRKLISFISENWMKAAASNCISVPMAYLSNSLIFFINPINIF